MAQKYQPVHVKLWGRPWFIELRPHGKLLFLYLLTNPANNPAGMFQCPLRTMAFGTGLSGKNTQAALDALAGHVEYDEAEALVWIRNGANYPPKNPRVLISMQNTLNEHDGHPFVAKFLDHHQWFSRTSNDTPEPSQQSKSKSG